MAFKKIDLNKNQTLIYLANDTGDRIDINRINPHNDVYDGFEITVVLEKPTVAPTSEAGNEIFLRCNTPDLVVTNSNLCLKTTDNSSGGNHRGQFVQSPTYYESSDVYSENCVCIVKLTWCSVISKWVESSRQYSSYL